MALMNRRNALLGWAVWQVGKQAAKRKARASVSGADDSRKPGKSAIAAGLATLGGVLWFRARRRTPDDES